MNKFIFIFLFLITSLSHAELIPYCDTKCEIKSEIKSEIKNKTEINSCQATLDAIAQDWKDIELASKDQQAAQNALNKATEALNASKINLAKHREVLNRILDNNPLPVPVEELELLFIYSDNCRPCELMRPVVKELQTSGINIKEIKDDGSYAVTATPTFILKNKGKEINRVTGMLTKESITDWVTRVKDWLNGK